MAEHQNKDKAKTVDDHRVTRLEEWAKGGGEKIGFRIKL
jgi:hypothetical protein